MKEITSDTLNIGQLLTAAGLNYPVWERTHVTKLVEDRQFSQELRGRARDPTRLFLGTIIISEGNDQFLTVKLHR